MLFTHLVCEFLTLRALRSSHQSSLLILWQHLPLWFYSQVLHSGITTFTFWLYSQVLHSDITSLTPFDFTHKFFILILHHSPPLTLLTSSSLCHHDIHLLTLLTSFSFSDHTTHHLWLYLQAVLLSDHHTHPFDFTHQFCYVHGALCKCNNFSRHAILKTDKHYTLLNLNVENPAVIFFFQETRRANMHWTYWNWCKWCSVELTLLLFFLLLLLLLMIFLERRQKQWMNVELNENLYHKMTLKKKKKKTQSFEIKLEEKHTVIFPKLGSTMLLFV